MKFYTGALGFLIDTFLGVNCGTLPNLLTQVIEKT